MSGRRIFTEAEDEIIRACQRGEVAVLDALLQLRTSNETMYRRMAELGLPARTRKKPTPKPPSELANVGPGWVPIAHKAGKFWRPLEGAPLDLRAARLAVAAGRAVTAQRRVDGGFDLLVRVVRA